MTTPAEGVAPAVPPVQSHEEAARARAQIREAAARARSMRPTKEAIESFFTYHSATPEQAEKYERINQAAKDLAYEIDACCEAGPDRTAAMRLVREARMTANASIATGNAIYR